MVLWLLGLIILGTTAARPNVVFPINSQVPPVARVSKPFHFQFAESTFSNILPDTIYTLSNSPAWLQLDGPTRSFSGTPGPQDVGPVSFEVVASDSSGSTAMAVTFIVSSNPGPALGRPVSEQLPAYGAISGPESITLPHSTPIAFSFSSDTFTNTDGSTVYYALCANNTPLPSWINFNANTLSFSGVTPQLTSPTELSEVYDIQLTASDVAGFASAIATFQLVIGSHVFTFGPAPLVLEISPGVDVNYYGLQTALTLDGRPIGYSEISKAAANTPVWMSMDTDLALAGTPPKDVSSVNFTVSVVDIYGDQATTVVCLVVAKAPGSPFFLNPIEPINATIGSNFEYSLTGVVEPDPSLQISLALDEAPWLQYNPETRKLQGHVPSNLDPGHVSVNITVSLSGQSQSQVLGIDLDRDAGAASSQPTSESTAATTASDAMAPSASATQSGAQEDPSLSVNHQRRNGLIAAGVVPLVIVLGMLSLFCWCRRRRKQQSSKPHFILSKDEISRPQLILAEKVVGKSGFEYTDNLDLETRQRNRHSIAPMLADLRRYSNRWSGLGYPSSGPFPEPEPKPQYQLAPEDYERLSQTDKASSRRRRSSTVPGGSSTLGYSVSKRYSKPRRYNSNMSTNSSNTPFTRSFSGFGHGRNGFSCSSIGRGRGIGLGHGNGGPSSCMEVRRSWRNPTSIRSRSSDWISVEAGSEQSEINFPRPPTSETLGAARMPYTIHEGSENAVDHYHQPTIRPVVPSSEDLWPERKAYLLRRARSRQGDNALFSAKDSRASSQILAGRPLRNSVLPEPEPLTTPPQTASDKENSIPPSSHSQSHNSTPSPPLKPLPSKPTTDQRPRDRRSTLFRYFPVRTLSPLRPRSNGRSNASVTSSRFRDAESDVQDAEGEGEGELRLEVDDQGQKKWRHIDRPNPLGSNSVRESILSYATGSGTAGGTEDGGRDGNRGFSERAELELNKLLGKVEGSRAQRLSALRGRDGWVGGDARSRDGEEGKRERRLYLGSLRGKRPVSVENGSGLNGGRSMRGDFGDVGNENGGGAFI